MEGPVLFSTLRLRPEGSEVEGPALSLSKGGVLMIEISVDTPIGNVRVEVPVNELVRLLTEADAIGALPAPYDFIVRLVLQMLKDREMRK